jgi:hypothetical protein
MTWLKLALTSSFSGSAHAIIALRQESSIGQKRYFMPWTLAMGHALRKDRTDKCDGKPVIGQSTFVFLAQEKVSLGLAGEHKSH